MQSRAQFEVNRTDFRDTRIVDLPAVAAPNSGYVVSMNEDAFA